MTVIRLVNDAVDDIESEGMSEFLFTRLSLHRLPLGAFTGVGLGHGVLNAAEAFFFFFNLDSINKKRLLHKCTIFVCVSQSGLVFDGSFWLLLCFFFVSLIL